MRVGSAGALLEIRGMTFGGAGPDIGSLGAARGDFRFSPRSISRLASDVGLSAGLVPLPLGPLPCLKRRGLPSRGLGGDPLGGRSGGVSLLRLLLGHKARPFRLLHLAEGVGTGSLGVIAYSEGGVTRRLCFVGPAVGGIASDLSGLLRVKGRLGDPFRIGGAGHRGGSTRLGGSG